MEFVPSEIPEVILIKPKVINDERGFFYESYKKSLFFKHGITEDFSQDNHSQSSLGVLRGLHYQLNPHAQAKLVRCSSGEIFDVAVDIRIGSPTFGKWVGYTLSQENRYMLYIPSGFAHGFLVLSKTAELLYKASGEYSKESDRGVSYNDPAIGIKWPEIAVPYVLSEKDQNQPLLKNCDNNFVYQKKFLQDKK